VSVLEEIQGLEIIKVDRNVSSGSKMTRFINMQSQIAKKLITLPFGAKHTKLCIDHMSKITANDTHARDDICDTLQMAIELALVDQSIINRYIYPSMDKTADTIMKKLANKHKHTQKLRGARQWLN
jgi:phage terminase large subunit-like protein